MFLEVSTELRKDLRDYPLFAWAMLDISRDDDSASGADDSFKLPHNSTRIWKQMDDITCDKHVEGIVRVMQLCDIGSSQASSALV